METPVLAVVKEEYKATKFNVGVIYVKEIHTISKAFYVCFIQYV